MWKNLVFNLLKLNEFIVFLGTSCEALKGLEIANIGKCLLKAHQELIELK